MLAPASAFAFTLSPASATDLTGTVQTLTATGLTPGTHVFFGITAGPNSATAIPDVDADGSGTATTSYVGANAGADTVVACIDPDQDETNEGNFAACNADISSGIEDNAEESNPATITGEQTLVLTPPGAFNLTGNANTHTVTATLNGVARCIGGSNDGTNCTVDSTCTGGGTCSDKSGLPVGFLVTGPNSQDTNVVKLTDGNGQVTFTYPDTGGAGTDMIQACADLFDNDPGESTSECISEVGFDSTDVASNTVRKSGVPRPLP